MALSIITHRRRWILILLIAILAEIFVFNIRFWDSLGNQEFKNYKTNWYGINVVNNELIFTEENGYLELNGFLEHISNLYLDLSDGSDDSVLSVNIQADDATSSSKKYTVNCGTAQIVDSVEATKYLRLHLREESTFLRIYFNVPEGTVLYLDDFRVNCIQPFSFIKQSCFTADGKKE